MMQFEQARQISLERILSKLGFEAAYASRVGESLWYHSPFRDEKTPSFKVDIRRNVWFDFGENIGGSPIDLIVQVFKTDVHGALKILSDFENAVFQKEEKRAPSVLKPFEIPQNTVFQLEKVADFKNEDTSLHRYIILKQCNDVMMYFKTTKINSTNQRKSLEINGKSKNYLISRKDSSPD